MAQEYSRKANNTTNYEHPSELNLWEVHRAMDYDPYGYPVLRIDDTTKQHTSKNRVKMSRQELLFFNNYVGGDDTEIWDTVTTGTASIAHDIYDNLIEMQVGSDAGDRVVRQTRRVIPYTPGRQNEISMAMRFTQPTIGVRRRHGAYDDFNGAYFEDGGDGTYYVVCRRNTAGGIIEERVARDDWNVDPLDGTGPSGIVANPDSVQLMVLEYEWYGAGQVEFNFVINNNKYPIHQFDHANRVEYVWSNSPFQPVRAEIENYGGAAGTHSYFVGSTAVQAEGQLGNRGIEFNASTPVTGKSTGTTANVFKPMVSIRMKSDRLDAVVIPLDFQAGTLDNTGIFYRIVQNPVLTGASWQPVEDNSDVEYDVSATAQTNGKVLKEGFISPNNQGQVVSFRDQVLAQLGRTTTTTIGDTSDILSIEIASIQANKDAYASINWLEQR